MVGIDILEMPRTLRWNRYVVVFVKYLTKAYVVEDQTSETLARLLVDNVICELNGSKTKFMVLTRTKPAKSVTSTPTLNNEQVDTFTYLGVLISANMSRGPHNIIETIASKAKGCWEPSIAVTMLTALLKFY